MRLKKRFLFLITTIFCIGSANCVHADAYALPQRYYVEADYLCWKASKSGAEFAETQFFTGREGELISPDWEWSSGFRVKAGGIYECTRNWDISLAYTHYNNSASNSVSDPAARILGIWQVGNNTTNTFASANWNLHFKTLDAIIATPFYCNCFRFKPSFGLLAAWIKNKYHINYVSVANPTTVNFTQNIRGIGPTIGLDTAWFFCKGFKFIGEANSALLIESIHNSRTDISGIGTNRVFEKKCQVIPVFRYCIGFGWEQCVWGRFLDLSLAWEHQWWLAKDVHIYAGISHELQLESSLSLYGVVARGRFIF